MGGSYATPSTHKHATHLLAHVTSLLTVFPSHLKVAFEEAMETSEAWTEEAIKETSMEASAIVETVEEVIEDLLPDF